MQQLGRPRRHWMQTWSWNLKTQHFILKKRGPRFVKFVINIFFLYPVSQFLFSMSVGLLSVARIDWTNWFWPTSKRLRLSKRGHGRSFGRIYPKSRHVLRNQRRSISNPYRQVNQLMPYQAERSAWSLSTSLVWNGNHDILYFILKKMIFH